MPITIALAGNPNSGKTTLFNTLTGSNQFVGNWPGVTVEKKEGRLKGHKDVTVMDLPGIYSLSPHSLEEMIARNYLIDERPDVILNIVDGTNLERNLFLTTQLTELGIPVVVAVNMMDIVDKTEDKIDTLRLSKELGCHVVKISALKGVGVDEAASAAIHTAQSDAALPPRCACGSKCDKSSSHCFSETRDRKAVAWHRFSPSLWHTLAHIEEAALHNLPPEQQMFFAVKLFERDCKIIEKLGLDEKQIAHIEEDIKRLEEEFDDDSESIIIAERYNYIDSIIKHCLNVKDKGKLSVSDKIDKVMTNRWLALPIFAAIMFIVYFVSVTVVGGLVTGLVNAGEASVPVFLKNALDAINCADWLQGLIIDGIVSGVGAVIGFVPQMLMLFIFLAFLEACGYMARIAFIMDRIFRRFGLSGKSFIPILIGTGCGVPGIMASRTIENDSNRKMTIITTTFIPCAAKLPVIALIAGAVFGGAAWVATSAYFAGIAAIVCSGIILKKTKPFAGGAAPFLMELPAYHWPTAQSVIRSMWERGWSFIKKAGTVILAATIFVWFASNFGFGDDGFGMVDMDKSILAKIGGFISALFIPLGWGNWQASVAALTGLIAKENVVGTLGILYGFAEVAEDGNEIWSRLAAEFTALSAYSFLLFNLLCAPCFAAIGAIKREMNSPKWFWFAIGYQCAFAYIVSFCVYQLGTLFTAGSFGVQTAFAFALSAGFIFMLARKH